MQNIKSMLKTTAPFSWLFGFYLQNHIPLSAYTPIPQQSFWRNLSSGKKKTLTFPGKLPRIFIKVVRIFPFEWKRVAGYNTLSLAIQVNPFCWDDCLESVSGRPEFIMLLSSCGVVFSIDALPSKACYCFLVSAVTTLQWQCRSKH